MLSKITPTSLSLPRQPPALQRQGAILQNEEAPPKNSLQALRNKQLADMQQGLKALQVLRQENSPKRQAAARAGYLKQRLEMLRTMLAKLPPGDHKALARELKQIARELAALGKSLGGKGLAAIPELSVQPDVASGDRAGTQGAAEGGVDAVAVAEAANADMDGSSDAIERQASDASISAHALDKQMTNRPEGASANTDKVQSGSKTTGVASSDAQDDKALRALLREAKRLLRQVVTHLKAKTITPDKESKKIFKDIEHSLRKLEDSLRDEDNQSYLETGETLSAGTDGSEMGQLGQALDVRA